jgi:hypothetical protein
MGMYHKLCETVDSLKDDRKWLARIVVGWVIMTLLGVIVVVIAK